MSTADQGPALDKNNPEKQGPARGRTKQRNTHKHKKQQRTHRNTETTAQEKANKRYCSGFYSSKFHPKAPKFFRHERNTLPSVTQQETLFGSHGKSETETNTPFPKKKGPAVGEGIEEKY